MHDIRLIRDDPQGFDAMLARRGLPRMSKKLLELDETWRSCVTDAERRQADLNAKAKEFSSVKQRGDWADAERLRQEIHGHKIAFSSARENVQSYREELDALLLTIPNTPLPDVPEGADDGANIELRRWGAAREFTFAPKEHYLLGEAMGCMDFETAARLSGSRFVVLNGALARLHRALAQFMLDTHVDENGLTEIWTPVIVRGEMLRGTGQLPKFTNDLYQISLREDFDWDKQSKWYRDYPNSSYFDVNALEKKWLIPTAEVTLTNMAADQIVDEATLPRRYTAWTQCFRSEAGSAGKDTRGMLRQHQFEKVEMVSITRPEDSGDELERMTRCAEGILERLEIPYRRMLLSTGDMGFSARKTHDIEVWLPGQGAWREISSCSVCGDFQARRMNARFRREGGKPEFVHTLNGSGLAVGRTLIAVMENGQREDGGIELPAALGPWLRGARRITPEGVLE